MNPGQRLKFLLTLGLLAFCGYISQARWRPIDGYELSIYTSIPLLGWVLLGVCLAIAIGLILGGERRGSRLAGLSLIVCVTIGFAGLPLLRGYTMYSGLDAIVHLGWVKDMLNGINIREFNFYPGLHFSAGFASLLLDIEPARAMLIYVMAFSVCYVIFVDLSVKRASPSNRAIGFGALLGVLFLPIMTVRLPVLQAVPATAATLFLGFVLFVLLMYIQQQQVEAWRTLLILGVASVTLFHPQLGLATAVVLGVTAFVVRHDIYRNTRLRPGYLLIASAFVLVVVYWLVSGIPSFTGAVAGVINGLLYSSPSSGTVTAPGEGLTEIGGSLAEVFLKVLTPKIIVSLLAGGFLTRIIYRYVKTGRIRRHEALSLLFGVGAASTSGFVVLFLVVGRLNQATRYVGMIMVFVSIIAGIGFATSRPELRERKSAIVAVGVVVFCLAGIAAPVLYQSPYVYQGSNHVSESELEGYDFAFEHQSTGTGLASTRSRVDRHEIRYFGRSEGITSPRAATVPTDRGEPYLMPYHFNGEYPSENIETTTYLALADSDRRQDIQLYDGLRYTTEDYARLRQDRNIDQPYSNGGFELYLMEQNSSS